MRRPFAIYIGRIDENKGCAELFSHFERYADDHPHGLDLVLVGSSLLPIPKHPRIRHLGFLSDEDKFDALAAADLLIMPSQYESLSMVALEAWALGKPVLANGRCDVLKGQCVRSNAGLYYESFEEFAEALYLLEAQRAAGRRARPQRPRLLPAPLRVAGDRTEVSRHVRAARARTGRRRSSRCPGSSRGASASLPPAASVVAGRARRGGARVTARDRRPRVHQILATLGYGDAIGNEVLGITPRAARGRLRRRRSSSRPPTRGSST